MSFEQLLCHNNCHYCPSDYDATPGVDYIIVQNQNISGMGTFNFTVPALATTNIEITVIDDNIAEYEYETIEGDLYVYPSDYCFHLHTDIEDNDGGWYVVYIKYEKTSLFFRFTF